ncbi:MAG TPA: RNA polymerase sigma factor [bacterium]|nr:RNA polymerase sigma factor [bacterium]
MKTECSGDRTKNKWITSPPFEALYQEYKNTVFCYAYHLTQNRHEADDLFQESWLRIMRKLPEKIKKTSLKAWIFTVVTNIYRDDLRKKRVRQMFLSRKIGSTRIEDSLNPHSRISPQESNTEMNDMNKEIFSAINRLPEKQRTIFILKEISGFKQTDIGDIMGIPVGSVKSLMHRAVKRLQRELASFRTEYIEERGQNAV